MERALRFITEFTKLSEADLSQEGVFRFFFQTDRKVLFLVDDNEKLTGIITLGNFIKNLNQVQEAVNRNFLFVKSTSADCMLSEAEAIYNKYNIRSDIPVIDEAQRIVGYITDLNLNFESETVHEKKIEDLLEKVNQYKESVYLQKELDAFYHIMEKTRVYAWDCQEFQRFFSLFGGKIKVSFLSGDEYLTYIEEILKNENHRQDERKTSVIFDLGQGNRRLLLKQLGVTFVYSPDKFMAEFSYLVENEEFTRMIRITETSVYRLCHFVDDVGMEDIKFQANSLMTKYFYDYMKREGIPVSLTDTGSVSTMQASWLVNGISGSADDYVGFIFCDLLEQQRTIDESLSGGDIPVYNFTGAANAKLTRHEKEWFEKYGTLEAFLDNENMEALELLYSGDCEKGMAGEYASGIRYLWPVKRRFENDITVYSDYKSKYINIENGFRRTCNQPEKYAHTIYLTGPCYVFGPFVEDSHTIPSLLAERLKEDGYSYRVVNLGVLASNKGSQLLKTLDLKPGDMIINMVYNENVERVKALFTNVTDPSGDFDAIPERADMFFDKSVHCNRKGNAVYADSIYRQIKASLLSADAAPVKKNQIYDILKTDVSDLHLYGFHQYVDMLRKEKEKIPFGAKTIGCVVMNCNPYTLGHQYLVEHALRNCDYLFVFIVQEDMSYFSFEDRIEIARINCQKYDNVSVVASGKMLASHVTFPDYFKREAVRDHSAAMNNMKVVPIVDLRVFSSYIAPVLGIRKRFVAEEPLDPVTRQYNEYMKEVLPVFGLEVEEIQRKTLGDGETISASVVRKLYKSRKFEDMKKMLTEDTYDYLVRKAGQYLGGETLPENGVL